MYLEKIDITDQLPRAHGALHLKSAGKSKIRNLFQQGSTKALFPRKVNGLECVVINTSGGLTGGDKFSNIFECEDQSKLTVTTQGCERIYKSNDGSAAIVENKIVLKNTASIYWLPQETIVFDQGKIKRELKVSLSSEAEALIVEPVIFGRLAMGETNISGCFDDTIEVCVDGKIIFLDKTRLSGNISKLLKRQAVAAGGSATASIIFKSKRAKLLLNRFKDHLNSYSGVSLIKDNFLVARLIAPTGYELRQMLVPIITEITDKNLPKAWRL